MKFNKIAVLDTGYDSYSYEEELLAGSGFHLELFPGERDDRKGKIKFSKDAVGLLIRWTQINDEFLQATPHLKAIVRYGVGYDNIDLDSASRFNVRIANVQGYANHAVSDHALALIYACARAIPAGEKSLKKNFCAPPFHDIIELHDKTLGIIGLGRIGGTLCKKVQLLFNRILAVDPYIPEARFVKLGAVKSSLENLLSESDIISIHCNLTDETTNLINKNNINLMHKKPILINTARGPVINEDDLYEGLQANKFHSLGLDVYQDEPPPVNRDELLEHPKVIATGHYAWYSTNSSIELQKRAANNLRIMLQGEIPEDCLNP